MPYTELSDQNKVLREVLILYKEQTCLWNSSHRLYGNKGARQRALDILVEKFREVRPEFDRLKLKKKIENLRTNYKRERNKVIKAKMTGGEYKPTLWYYSLLSFLDKHKDYEREEANQDTTDSSEQIVTVNDDDEDDENEDSSTEILETPSSPPTKRSKTATVYLNESGTAYVFEPMKTSPAAKKNKRANSDDHLYLGDNDNLFPEEPSCSVKNEPSEGYSSTAESDLFAKTMSSQLNELRPKQRFIAEKLISEIIFFGRLDKLKTGTSLNLNNDI